MKTDSLSVIIPVYNEERTLPSVIEVVRSWGKATEIIVVDDGSTDHTAASVHQFARTIELISYKRNIGKAHAMVRGIEAAIGTYILFLDGDLVGLTHRDLDHLVGPIIAGRADMTIGARWTHEKDLQLFKAIGGERAFRRSDLLPILDRIKHLGYGVELFFNDHFKKQRVVYVDMPYVSILVKFEKQSIPEGAVSYVKEAFDLVSQIARQQAGTVTPHVRRLYTIVEEYLKETLRYFQ